VVQLRIIPQIIVVPEREVVKLGERWIIYLPQQYAEIWEELKRQRKKVRVYIEVLEGVARG